jgi:hydrogenase expression/formation protein HypE
MMEDDRISLAHGNGGRFMRELIEEVFAHHLGPETLDIQADAAPIQLNGGDVLITTDGFTVQPLEFPGGDIGSLAVHGTTNDLAVAGAKPMYLTLNAFIEEGFEVERLDRIIASLARAARESSVQISAGDTKVPASACACLAWFRPSIAFRTVTSSSLADQSATTAPPLCSPAKSSVCAVIWFRMQRR